MPETKDEDDAGSTNPAIQSLPVIREEAKLVLEKFLKRSLSQNDASPVKQVLYGQNQLEVITEGKTAVSENGTKYHGEHRAKHKVKHMPAKNGALKTRPSFDRSDSYIAAARQSVLDQIVKQGHAKENRELKPKGRSKSYTISSSNYKDNVKRASTGSITRHASDSHKSDVTGPLMPGLNTIDPSSAVDRKDSFSSRHDSSSDEEEEKPKRKKNVFKRAKERLRMSFRKREINAKEKERKNSLKQSPKHQPSAPVISITKATPSPDKSNSSGSGPVSSPSTGDLLEEMRVPTPSSRGSTDTSLDRKPSAAHSEGYYVAETPSPKSSAKHSVLPAPEEEAPKLSFWQRIRSSKFNLRRKSSKERSSSPTKSKSTEGISSLFISDTRLARHSVQSTEILRTTSLGRYEGMRVKTNLDSVQLRTRSVGQYDKDKLGSKTEGGLVAHGASGESLERDKDASLKRKGSSGKSDEAKISRTFSFGRGDGAGAAKKHSFKGRCSYAEREHLKLDLVPCRPSVSSGDKLSSIVVPDNDSDDDLLSPSGKPLSARTPAEKDEIYNKIAERLASIAEGYPITPRGNPRAAISVTQNRPNTPPGAAGGRHQDELVEAEIASLLRQRADKYVEGTEIPTDALMDIVKTMSYRKFRKVLRQYMTNSEPNFHQLAMLFSLARGAVQLVGAGGTAAHNIKEMTLNYFVDYFAGWIVGKGGWDSVIESADDDDDTDYGTQV